MHRNRPFTYHYLVGSSDLSNLSCTKLAVLDVSGSAGADTGHLSGGVYTDENDIGFQDRGVNVGGEKQVPNAQRKLEMSHAYRNTE